MRDSLGADFESLARAWTGRYASARSLGGRPKRVGFVQVNDPVARQSFELDVVAEAQETMGGKRVILAIGEAKGSDSQRSASDIARLERLRGLLASRADVSRTRLLLFARSGFQPDVIDLARRRRDVELVDLDRLYGGD